ncbi:trithorax group protein osa-like [Salvelinus alpinus]|uniref:trithorax group protein osa-like n=1 Tax=Salvelinus alpinus TaxID=8036 RepID=UPI0039FBEAFA
MAQAQEERPSEQEKEMGEETFLKDLYLHMKKRDTPIERIPHLGFKLIDLFMMYKTVKSMGGYLQVTTQQLWKQVYNTLGGNPRSTSAATCTRRHYEKLLLAYECHVRGENYMEVLPRHQQKRLHYCSLGEEEECPRTAKRSMTYGALQTSQQQNPHHFLTDSRVRIIPMPAHYHPNYHHLGHPALPPYVHPPLTPGSHPSSHPRPQPPYLPSPQGQTERAKQPLERLRLLANRYKCSSDWNEPLNLSCKKACLESGGQPASSFAPPPSNKSPKFLNTPSPLYPTKEMAKDECCETPEGKSPPERSYLYPLATRDGYVIDLTSSSGGSSRSPTPASSPGMKTESPVPCPLQSSKTSAPSMVHVPRPLKREYPDWPMGERRGESPKHSPGPLNLSCALPSPPRETGGRMEIQIPLALLQDWIKGGLLCGPAGSRPGAPSLHGPTPPEPRERTQTRTDISPTMANHADQVFHSPHRDQDRSSGYLRERSLERYRNLPSPTTTSPTSSHRHPMAPYQISSYKAQLSGSILCNPASRDLYPWEKQENTRRPYHPNPMHPHDLRDRAQPIPLKIHPSSQALEQDDVGPTSLACSPDTSQGMVENSRMALMVDPSSSSLIPLTPEEFMKLKRLISSSS